MTKITAQLLVVTDLDGTLLDHHTYSWQAAASVLADLKRRQIPVVINTSKTFNEVVALQKDLGIQAPFIIENGSAVALPEQQFDSFAEKLQPQAGFYVKLLGKPREEIVSFLHGIRKNLRLSFSGYSDWNVEKVSELTGLDKESAKQSQARAYSEPLIWEDSEENFLHFKQQLSANQFTLLQGGRFFHVLGDCNKGMATQWVQTLYAENTPLVCLGDSPNDVDMLNVADTPVLVKSSKQDYPMLSKPNPNTIRTVGVGPVGWAEALNHILKQFK